MKIWASALAASVVLAAWAVLSPSSALVVLLLAALVIVVIKSPDTLIFLTLVTATITLPAFVPSSFSVGPVSIKAYEPLLALSVIYTLIRYRGRLPAALGGFAALIIVWATLGLIAGHDTSKIIYDVRNLLMLLGACFVACRVADSDVPHRILRWIKWVLWLSAGLSILASATSIPLAGRSEEAALPVSGATAVESALRLLTPATHLSLAVLCVIAVLVVTRRSKFSDVLGFLMPSLLMVFISFSRNSILGLAVSVVFALLASRNIRSAARTATGSLAAAAGFWLLVVSSSSLNSLPGGAWLNRQVEGFSDRVLGGLTSETLAVDNSAQFRFLQENALILPRIGEAPLFGHGFGFAYKLPSGIPGTFSADFAPYYAHNFYLWILAKAGLIGLFLFLWLALTPVLKSLRGGSTIAVATGGAVVALLATSFVAPMPIGSPTGLILGALVGCCYASIGLNRSVPLSGHTKSMPADVPLGPGRNFATGRERLVPSKLPSGLRKG